MRLFVDKRSISKLMIWEGHATRIGEVRYSYRISVGKYERTSSVGITRNMWDNFKFNFAKTGYADVNWIHLDKYRIKSWIITADMDTLVIISVQ
jgi:hypothetical protein